jgi:hypothetical protein
MAALLIWLLVAVSHPSFQGRWVAMPAAISWATFEAARKASERPSFCKWFGAEGDCRIS